MNKRDEFIKEIEEDLEHCNLAIKEAQESIKECGEIIEQKKDEIVELHKLLKLLSKGKK